MPDRDTSLDGAALAQACDALDRLVDQVVGLHGTAQEVRRLAEARAHGGETGDPYDVSTPMARTAQALWDASDGDDWRQATCLLMDTVAVARAAVREGWVHQQVDDLHQDVTYTLGGLVRLGVAGDVGVLMDSYGRGADHLSLWSALVAAEQAAEAVRGR